MKQITKFFASAVVMIAFSASTFAQVTASANASATIVTPITIAKTVDMDFGNVYIDPAIAGTVVLAPDGSRTAFNGAGLPGAVGSPAAASFTITGTADAIFTIALPSSPTTITNGTDIMTVDNFTGSLSSPATITGGSVVLNVGATLNIAGGISTGLYTSAIPFDVTVNYQ